MDDAMTHDLEEKLSALEEQALRHTRASVKHMEKYDIRPGRQRPTLSSPEERARDEINRCLMSTTRSKPSCTRQSRGILGTLSFLRAPRLRHAPR